MKHLEIRQKYSAARLIFNSLLGVPFGDETLRLMLDILLLITFLRLICYEFVSSSTLEDFLCDKGTVLNFDGVCTVATDVISAIERLEDLGILHNNISTRNILIGPCTRVSKPMCCL